MSALPNSNLDRRYYPRTLINSQVKYKLSDESTYNTGLMLDISQTGILIGSNHQLQTDTPITVMMESGQEDESPIEIAAEVIRIAEAFDSYDYTYGCMILDVKEF